MHTLNNVIMDSAFCVIQKLVVSLTGGNRMKKLILTIVLCAFAMVVAGLNVRSMQNRGVKEATVEAEVEDIVGMNKGSRGEISWNVIYKYSYKGKEYPFYISLGYAEYPTFASNYAQLMRCADAALYEIKLHGKNGCMAYKNGLQLGARKQLGFAPKDISEHLPGAFIIYRADKTDDELFYANHEFLRMTGYKNMDELFRLAKKSFRNLIREDEQQKIESSIWEQIDSGNENDYIHFHLRKADGSYLSVLDHGRIVNSQQYGRVFYVLFTDWEDMHIHYGDKFSE